jgi:sodium-dependent dicarboxylate transporter 2/3/5
VIPLKTLSGPLLGVLTFYLLRDLPPMSHGSAAILGITIWMLCWWIFEVVPLAVTAFLPLITFPLLGIASFKDTAAHYTSEVIFLFLGGFFLSAAVEKWNLHLWFSQHIVKWGARSPTRMLSAFMIATTFISMWISNTAATLIMLPLVKSILRHSSGEKQKSLFSKALLLGVAFAASIGGLGTPIGSPPNAILFAYMKKDPSIYGQVSFLGWTVVAFPLTLIALGLLLAVFKFLYFPKKENDKFLESLQNSTAFLQSIKWTPTMTRVAIVFGFMTSFWLLAPIFKLNLLTDAWISIVGGLTLFLIPSGVNAADKPQKRLLDSDDFDKQPWNILILFGGGLALSEGMAKSGILKLVSEYSTTISHWPLFLIIFVSVCALILLTEIGSNTAIAAIFIPLAGAMATSLNVPQASLLFAVTAAGSLSFMLPMATPPNAIVFSLGHFKLNEMIKVGAVLDLLFALLITAYCYFLLPWLAEISGFGTPI